MNVQANAKMEKTTLENDDGAMAVMRRERSMLLGVDVGGGMVGIGLGRDDVLCSIRAATSERGHNRPNPFLKYPSTRRR